MPDAQNQPTPPDASPRPGFAWVRALAVMVAMSAAFVAAALFLLPSVGWAGHERDALWAIAVVGGFGVVSMIVIALLDRRMPYGAAYGFMASMVVRMVGCAAAVFVGQRLGMDAAFGLWVAGLYMVYLVAEVALVGQYVKTLVRPAAPPGSDRKGDGSARMEALL
jgi:NO-binding membrane sensor protein with MHYT domain